ncbi:hypothetical protein RclHR1_05530016 [Rhizophagus clarus]|uniref:Uncharacterized protein n=1 Tax=Rhizophagus clarus TaxID=94130 RepID=A0A2Z6SFC0_9GLOM|nr:hypothetical protein RclHR1_05530016 [Rhizophagus clarus]GET03703.1 hypothetical protein GLOIN_2v51277 [Rhizophagus clarus]
MTFPKYLQILTVIIAFISIISISYNPKYVWSIIDTILNYFFTVDDPIFRNLANSTTILIEDIIKFNVPASSNIIKLRETSNFLSDIISLSSINLSPVLYLQTLGDKAYIAGTKIEKIYNTGIFAFDEIFNELQDIRQNLPKSSQNPLTKKDAEYFLLTQKDAEYFLARFRQIFNLVTEFRDKFVDIEETIREIQKLYHGHNNVQGFLNIIKYFNENELTHKKIFDMKIVQSELNFERNQMDQLIVIDYEVMRVGKSLDIFRKNLDLFIERIIYLSNKKIMTQEDGQMLEKVIEIVNTAKEIWGRMDKVDDNRILQIEG